MKTTVKSMQIKEKKVPQPEMAELQKVAPIQYDAPEKKLLDPDRLLKNIALSCSLMLVLLAIRSVNTPQAQTVFSALEAGMNTNWDESLGRLSFVSSMLPEDIRAVWAMEEPASVFQPVSGEIVHAWTQQEPYLELMGESSAVFAVADGEIMSIAHGLEEEKILRIRHEDGTEALYGNLESCCFEVGDYVLAGDMVATLLKEKPLAFEYRKNGRSVALTEDDFLPKDQK